MNFHDIDPGGFQEEATIISVFLLMIGLIFPILQDVALSATVLVACGTLFLNRKKYYKEVRELEIYKWIANGFKKNNRRTPKT